MSNPQTIGTLLCGSKSAGESSQHRGACYGIWVVQPHLVKMALFKAKNDALITQEKEEAFFLESSKG